MVTLGQGFIKQFRQALSGLSGSSAGRHYIACVDYRATVFSQTTTAASCRKVTKQFIHVLSVLVQSFIMHGILYSKSTCDVVAINELLYFHISITLKHRRIKR